MRFSTQFRHAILRLRQRQAATKVKWIWLMTGSASLVLAACGKTSSGDIALINAGFEDSVPRVGIIPGWIVSQHAGPLSYEMTVDDRVHAEGHASFRIKRLREQVYGRIVQRVPIHDLDGRTVEVSAMIKTEDVGSRGAILQLTQEGKATDRVTTDALSGTQDFKRVSARMKILPGANDLEVGATLRDGGTVWLDDVRLNIVEP
jgi:hypothetical protein